MLVIEYCGHFIVSLFVNCVLCCSLCILLLSFVYFKGLCRDGHCTLARAINAVGCGIGSCYILVLIQINIK